MLNLIGFKSRLDPQSGWVVLTAMAILLLFFVSLRWQLPAMYSSDVSWMRSALSVAFLLLLLVIGWLIGAFPRSAVMPDLGRLTLLSLLMPSGLIAAAQLATDLWHRPPLTLNEYRWLGVLGGLTAFLALVILWQASHQEWTRIRERTSRDFLTSLLNRDGFMFALTRASFTSGTLAVLDLNRLKWINDRHGHATGDRQIQDVAHALVGSLPSTALTARWGGDEFLIFLPEIRPTEAEHLLNAAQKQVPSLLNGQPTFMFGLAQLDGQADLERALAVADHELYLAKSQHTGDETALEDERLLDFARQLKRLQNSEEVLGQGLQMTRRLANFEVAAYIVVKGHEYQVQHVDAGLGVDPEILKCEGARLLSGLILETVQQRSAIVSVDFPHDLCTDHAGKARGIKTAILTPVDQGGEIVGLLALFNFSHHRVVPKRTQRAVELAALRMGYALELLFTVQSVRQTLEGGLLNLGVALEDHDLETQGYTARVVELSTQSGAEPGLIPEGLDDLR